jgi:hypothetical protein
VTVISGPEPLPPPPLEATHGGGVVGNCCCCCCSGWCFFGGRGGSHDAYHPPYMFVVLILLVQLYACVYLVNFYLLSFILLIYALSYWDGKEYTGERRWTWFRQLRVWRYLSPVEYTFTSVKELSLVNHQTRRVYVMVPDGGGTLVSLVWGIGLHGGELAPAFAERLHYVVPPLFMWVPLLRDVLLWTGAVTFHPRKRPLDSVVLELLHCNRAVCIPTTSPQGDVVGIDIEAGHGLSPLPSPPPQAGEVIRSVLSDDILSFARAEKIQLVPIVTHGEHRRYAIATHRLLSRIQQYCRQFTLCGAGMHPFPVVFSLRLCSRQRPPPLHQQFGPIIECTEKFATNEQLMESFEECVQSLTCVELGDDILKLR